MRFEKSETLADICSRGTKRSISKAVGQMREGYARKGRSLTPLQIWNFRRHIEQYSRPDAPPGNARILVSRNKREGKYMRTNFTNIS